MIRTKEAGLTVFGVNIGLSFDGLAILVLREIINALGDATIRWINDAFDDSPAGNKQAFAVDLEKVLKDSGDIIAGNIIGNLVDANLCSPFKGQIEFALKEINKPNKNVDAFEGLCPLSGIVGNFDDYINGNFIDNGGWDSWIKMTQDPMGNPYSSLLVIQGDINYKAQSETNIRNTQLEWGKGFFATAPCKTRAQDGIRCAEYNPIKTPGTVIENQLEKTLNVEVDQLNIADEFDEVITAIAGQLLDLVMHRTKGIFDSANRNYTGGSNPPGGTPPNQGSCSPSSDTAIVGDEITWTYTGATNALTIYQWSGKDGLTGTSTSAKITYTTPGVKDATITVTKRILAGLQADGITPLYTVLPPAVIRCVPDVTVARFGPLAISCTINDKSNMFIPPPGVRTWTIKITGGSGQLSFINVDEYKTLGRPKTGLPIPVDPLFPAPVIGGILVPLHPFDIETPYIRTAPGVAAPSVPFNSAQPTTTGGIILTAQILYTTPGTKEFAFQEIWDVDPTVPVLRDAKCKNTDFDVLKTP
jgi:plastocyanin